MLIHFVLLGFFNDHLINMPVTDAKLNSEKTCVFVYKNKIFIFQISTRRKTITLKNMKSHYKISFKELRKPRELHSRSDLLAIIIICNNVIVLWPKVIQHGVYELCQIIVFTPFPIVPCSGVIQNFWPPVRNILA